MQSCISLDWITKGFMVKKIRKAILKGIWQFCAFLSIFMSKSFPEMYGSVSVNGIATGLTEMRKLGLLGI